MKKLILVLLTALLLAVTASAMAGEASADGYEYTVVDGEVYITGYSGEEKVLDVPGEIDGMPVVSFGLDADPGDLSAGKGIHTVNLPASVRKIASHAFYWESVTTVTGLENVEEIGEYAFYACRAKELVFSEKLCTVEFNGLRNIFTLERLVVPDALPLDTLNIRNAANWTLDIDLIATSDPAWVKHGNGCITSADGTVLLYVPADYAGAALEIAAGTTRLCQGALGYNQPIASLMEVVFPDSISVIEENGIGFVPYAANSEEGNQPLFVIWCSEGSETARYCQLNGLCWYETGEQTIRQRMQEAVGECKCEDDYDTALRLHDWLQQSMQQRLIYPQYAPAAMMLSGGYDGVGPARVYAQLLRMAGISAQVIDVDGELLAWVKAELDDAWYHIDIVTNRDSGTKEYFGLPDAAINDDLHAAGASHPGAACTGYAASWIYRGGVYDWAFSDGEKAVQQNLDEGKRTFTLETTYSPRLGVVLALYLQDQTYTADGGAYRFKAQYHPDDRLIHVMPDFDDSALAGFLYSVGEDGVCIEGYYGAAAEVVIPAYADGIPVTALADCAFLARSDITSVTLPDTLRTIGVSAFERCHGLKMITIPAGVTELPEGVFHACEGLETLILKGRVTSLGEGAFSMCRNLRRIQGDLTGVTELPAHVFSDCHLLEIPALGKLTALGESVFQSCHQLTAFEIPQGVKTVPAFAFNDCVNLKSVTLPDTLEAIGAYAFAYAPLESIDLPAGVKTLETNALNCAGSVSIPAGMTTIEPGAISTTAALTLSEENTAFILQDGALYDQAMTRLLWYSASAQAKTFTVPSGVRTIDSRAFENNPHVQEIILPADLAEIGGYAFRGCTALRRLHIPGSVKNIPENMLDLTGSCTVTLGTGVETISGGAMMQLGNTLLWLPDSITTVGEGAFSMSHNLERLKLSESMTVLPACLYECSALTCLYIPKAVESIAADLFSGAPVPAGFTIYGFAGSYAQTYAANYGFPFVEVTDAATPFPGDECSHTISIRALEHVTTGTVSSVYAELSCGGTCGAVLQWQLADGPLQAAADDRIVLELSDVGVYDLTLTDGLGQTAAARVVAHAARRYVLPADVTEIAEGAFRSDAVQELVIPANAARIGAYAFADCPALALVVFEADSVDIAADAFAGSDVCFLCHEGSAAWAYAQTHGIPCVSLD